MERIVEPEWLDQLSASDPRAIRSRRDLRVINRWMRNFGFLRNSLLQLPSVPGRILEIGAGDGSLMARLAETLAPVWKSNAEVWLLDREPAITPETIQRIERAGWTARIVKMDLHDWCRTPEPDSVDVIVANLFLHHFKEAELASLFATLSARTSHFIAVEPRRWTPAMISIRFLWLLGCNQVTRHDARLSVRAGFNHNELSRCWPAESGFTLREVPAGYASHLFRAHRANGS